MSARMWAALLALACAAMCTPTSVAAQAPIALQITGTSGELGAKLGLTEMSRTAGLLGRRLNVGGTSGARIDLDRGSIVAGGTTYFVVADDQTKSRALASWRRTHRDGAVAAVEWHSSLTKFGAEQLNERFTRQTGRPMDAAAWVSWMLVKLSVDAKLRGVELTDAVFDGHKGVPLTFDARRRLKQPLCVLDKSGALLGVVE